MLSGLLKLIYPHGQVTDPELEELLLLALEGRQRIRDQLHLMAPGEYYPVKVSARMIPSGKVLTPSLLETERKQRITLPTLTPEFSLSSPDSRPKIKIFSANLPPFHPNSTPNNPISTRSNHPTATRVSTPRLNFLQLVTNSNKCAIIDRGGFAFIAVREPSTYLTTPATARSPILVASLS